LLSYFTVLFFMVVFLLGFFYAAIRSPSPQGARLRHGIDQPCA